MSHDVRSPEEARRTARRAGSGSSDSRDGVRLGASASAAGRPVLDASGRSVLTPRGFPLYL